MWNTRFLINLEYSRHNSLALHNYKRTSLIRKLLCGEPTVSLCSIISVLGYTVSHPSTVCASEIMRMMTSDVNREWSHNMTSITGLAFFVQIFRSQEDKMWSKVLRIIVDNPICDEFIPITLHFRSAPQLKSSMVIQIRCLPSVPCLINRLPTFS